MTKDIETGVSMYDFNRANMGKLPLLDEEGIEGAKNVVRKFLTRQTENFYYMLLNHENRYFTLFEFTHNIKSDGRINTMADDVIECMLNCGFGIIDINEDEIGMALEVWVKDIETEAVHMYLLFPYDFGVIKY
jgi:hypothetical protein